MSIAVMAEIFRRDFGTVSRTMLAIRLADFADDDGCGIWPSVERLTLECKISRRTVQRILSDFQAEGILIKQEEGGGAGKPSRYDFNLDKLPPRNEPKKGVTVTPFFNKKGVTDDKKGVTDDTKGRHGDAQTIIEPLNNHHSLRASARGEKKTDEKIHQVKGDRDRRFWNAFATYPRFKVSPKEPMFKAWTDGISEEDREAITPDRVQAYLQICRNEGISHPPAIATVLSERLLFDPAIDDLLATRKPAPSEDRSQLLKPFGKAWMQVRLVTLLRGPAKSLDKVPEWKQARECWPMVYRLDHGPLVKLDPDRAISDKTLDGFEAVGVGSDAYAAWKTLHDENGWPFIDVPEHVEAVWFPMRDAVQWFEAQGGKGETDAA